MSNARLTIYFKFSCYLRRRMSLNVLLTSEDKTVLVELFYLSQESLIKALRLAPRYWKPRTSAVALQKDSLSEKSTSGVIISRYVQRIILVPKKSISTVLHCVLNLYPYKLQPLHHLLPNDAAKREGFAGLSLIKFWNDAQCLLNMLWTIEDHLSLHGIVNTHNYLFWA